MSNRIVPLVITVGVSSALAALIGLSPIGLSTSQAVPSVCHVPPGNPAAANEIPPDDASYAAHLAHSDDFLITEGLTCPATVPTLPTLPDTTVGDPVPTDPTVPTTVGDPVPTDPVPTDPTTTVAGTVPTTTGGAPVSTVAVLPTGTVAQTSPTLPSSK